MTSGSERNRDVTEQSVDDTTDQEESPQQEYGTAALNKRKKTIFTAWPDNAFSATEVVEVEAEPEKVEDRSSVLWRVLLHIVGSQVTTIGMDVWRVTVLGRSDPTWHFRPDLDFSPYNGMRMGVSRRHALIKPDTTSLSLIDQNSTNGTWVNGQRLSPGREFKLSDGDRIELGDLKFAIRVMNSPVGLIR